MAVNTVANWPSTFTTSNVQAQGVKGADFLSSESVVLVSGPPSFKDVTQVSDLIPIGLVQNVRVNQQKQINQLFEVGSREPFFIPGRTLISGSMARILFDGPSLMHSMYMLKGAGEDKAKLPSDLTGTAIDSPTLPFVETPTEYDPLLDGSTGASTYGKFFINLASVFFNKPSGLGFIFYDGEQQAYGGFYLEKCYTEAYQIAIQSQQTVLVENISFRAASLKPVHWNAIPSGV